MAVVVLVGTAKGAAILRSSPARDRWEIEGLLFKGWRVTAATRDPGGRFFVAVAHETFGPTIMSSDDLKEFRKAEQGPEWQADDPGNAEHNRIIGCTDPLGRFKGEGRHLDQIWRLHAAGGDLYAGVSEAGLFRSRDRGESWEGVRGINEHASRAEWIPGFGGLGLHAILVDPRNPARIWVGISSSGAFRSSDGGATWSRINQGVPKDEGWCVHSLAQHPDDPDTIFRQDHRGFFTSRDAGDSWQRRERGLPLGTIHGGERAVFGFVSAVDPASGAAYCIPLEGDDFRHPIDGRLRVFRSRDRGASWEPLGKGLPDANAYVNVLRGAFAVDGLDPGGLYFGTTAGTVFTSRDAGESWTQLPVTLPRVLCVNAFEV